MIPAWWPADSRVEQVEKMGLSVPAREGVESRLLPKSWGDIKCAFPSSRTGTNLSTSLPCLFHFL